jgi:RNA polymerase sigma-70 factor, ECF subfamily
MALAPGNLSPRWPPLGAWLAAIIRRSPTERDGQATSQQNHGEAEIAAFEAFFRRYEPQITGYLWRVTGDMELARDLCQDTFVRAWQHFTAVQGYAQLAQWLYRVATNLMLNQRRRPTMASLEAFDPASSDPSGQLVERALVQSILQELPPKQRALLVLHEVQGISYAEMATMLDMSTDAVRMALSRAREQFRQRYTRKNSD